MKKIAFFAVVLLTLFACKNQAKQFSGDYSYKISGNLLISGDSTQISKELGETIGQLTIADMKTSNNDSILLVFSELRGKITSVRAQIVGDSVFLKPYTKKIQVINDLQLLDFDVAVSGKGVRYDKTLILNEIYRGETAINDSVSYILSSNDITIVAKKN